MKLRNFGRNVCFDASRVIPVDRAAILARLEEGRQVVSRAIGSLHSWSDASVTSRAFDLRHFRGVRLTTEDGQLWADIEAGSTVNSVLDYLRQHGDYTLPVYGIIGKQTIAGAISTATHGSGRPSMSHYVSRITAAAFDPESGHPRIHTWEKGEALQAARCAVGCTGIVLSVRMPVEPEYLLEERTALFERLESVLDLQDEYPRLQFYLIPWSWKWLAHLRRPIGPPSTRKPGPRVWLRRWTTFLLIDVLMHGIVRLLAGYLKWWGALRSFHRQIVPRGVGAGTIVDRSRYILQMRHDLYSHVEMELFVPVHRVAHAAALVEWVLRWCGGESPEMPEMLSRDNFGFDAADRIKSLQGSYVHDYLITFRRVLADDTLISMTSGDVDAWYAVSLITYQRDREPFLRVARFLATAMASAYGARPHWGKICPLGAQELTALYPSLSRFHAHCAAVDPFRIFVSDFARRTLGFS